jgi:hypothetical protein
MRVAVIRGDISGPIYLSDLEPTSQVNPMIEHGQTRYLSRPSATLVSAALAGIPASIESTGAITFPKTINSGNKVLKLRLASSGAFVTLTLVEAAYASLTALAAQVQTQIDASALAGLVTAGLGSSANILRLTTVAKGEGVTIETDTTGGGSTFNTPAGFGSGGQQLSVPTAAALISTTVPVGGPVDVSDATLTDELGPAVTAAQLLAVADTLAPHFVETDVVKKSYLSGNLHGLLSSSFNPDPNRYNNGAAIAVVEDDGSTTFSLAGPVLTSATLSGTLTLAGTALASYGDAAVLKTLRVQITGSGGPKTLTELQISQAGGTLSATSIVIPAGLISGVAVSTSSVMVLVNGMVTATVAVV